MRQLVQDFYRHLREDDPKALDEVVAQGLSLEQVQAFAEGDLHEYALRHGAFKSVAWLASRQIVPTNWNALAELAARKLLNRGWENVKRSSGATPFSGIPSEVLVLVETAFRNAGGAEKVFERLFRNRGEMKDKDGSSSLGSLLEKTLTSPELIAAVVASLRRQHSSTEAYGDKTP